jgi:microcystin-dependent protein
MTEPFLGEIKAFGFGFVPKGWLPCDGRSLPIQQFTALFSLLGTNFGGNGTTNFDLPDLRGCTPLGVGARPGASVYNIGESGGVENVTLLQAEMPGHGHAMIADQAPAVIASPTNNYLAQPPAGKNLYGPPANLVPLNPGTIGVAGGGQPHENMQPYLAVNYCIAATGVYPSRP